MVQTFVLILQEQVQRGHGQEAAMTESLISLV